MLYRMLADLVVVTHVVFIAFVAVGSLLVWKWPRLLWPHLAVVAWAAAIVAVGFTCPLTPLEKHLREQAGQSSYDGGFIDHYLDGCHLPRPIHDACPTACRVADCRWLRSAPHPRTT